MYPSLRNLHLIFGLLAVPFVLVYSVSAIQMAHMGRLNMISSVRESTLALAPGYDNSRLLAAELMNAYGLKGELTRVQATPESMSLRISVPGTVHEVSYKIATGEANVKTTVSGFLGVMNRLHHAAGLWPAYGPLRLWGGAVLLLSLVMVGLGVTGIWMWWLRRQDRALGLLFISANVLVSLVLLILLRAAS